MINRTHLMMLLCLLACLRVDGQALDPAPRAADDQVAALRQTLLQEQEKVTRLQDEHQAAVAGKTGKRRALAAELLNIHVQTRQIEEENVQLAETAEALEKQAAEAENARRQGGDAVAALTEALSVYLAEIPGAASDSRVHADESEKADADPAGLAQRMMQLEDTLQAASHIRVRPVTLRTAAGVRERVLLLSIGHVAAAYQVQNEPDRLGMAMASPMDASGFRWTEALPTDIKTMLARGIHSLSGSAGFTAPAVVRLPMDVTGQLPANENYRTTGLFAILAKGRMAMIPLLVIAGVALVLLAERFAVLYLCNPLDSKLVGKTLSLYYKEGKTPAQSLVGTRRGVLPRVLGACLAAQEGGAEDMEDRIQAQLLYDLPTLRRFLSGLAILAAVAPLLGLLGTVTGIIRTFEAMQVFGNANPHLLAGGISEALITTATGLVVAIPILLLRGLLSGRADRIIAQTESQAATLLNALTGEDVAYDD